MLKKNWTKTTIAKNVEINMNAYSLKDKWEFISYLDTGNITENKISSIQHLDILADKIPSRARRKVNIGDILYSTVRPNQKHYGIIKEYFENMLVSTGFAVITTKEKLLYNKYLYYYLIQEDITKYLHSIAENTVSTYPSIKPCDIANLEIYLPPLEEQKRIADILSSFDDKIELLQKQNKTLEDMAKAIFKSWFVDFDIVKAKERKEKKSKILNEYKITEEIYNLFPDSFEDSELGKIPKGWEVKKLGDIIKFVKGKKPKDLSLKIKDNYLPQILIETFDTGKSVFANPEQTICVGLKDLIIVMDGASSGRIEYGYTGILGSTLAKIETSIGNKNIIYCLLKMKEEDLKINTTGSSIPHLDKTRLLNYHISLCKELVILFNNIVDDYFHKIIINRYQIKTLTEIRDTLLPKLISGEIEV